MFPRKPATSIIGTVHCSVKAIVAVTFGFHPIHMGTIHQTPSPGITTGAFSLVESRAWKSTANRRADGLSGIGWPASACSCLPIGCCASSS